MQELLSHPAVQSSVVPLFAALAVGALLLRTRVAGLGIAAGFVATVYLVGNFALEPLTATRRLVLVGTSAALLGAFADIALKPSRANIATLAAIFAGASLWVFWNVLVQRSTAGAFVAGAATCAFVAWLVATSQPLRHDPVRAGAAGMGLGLGVGVAAILGASALLGQYGLALGAACGGFLLLVLVTARPAIAGTAATLTFAVVCGLIGAAAVLLAELAWWSLAVLGLTPVAARLPLPRKQGTWLSALFACAYVFIVAAAACGLAYLATRTPSGQEIAILREELNMQSRSIVVALTALAAPLTALAAPETYTMDPPHSIPQFELDYIGFTTIHGRFDKTSGKFTIDRAAKTGTVEYVIEASSVTTGDTERGSRPRTRDEHLRTADFFNVAEFPRLTFKGSAVRFSGEAPAQIDGQLTIVGVTRPVSLKVERWKCGMHPFYKKEACGADAVGKIKRSEFGMKYGIPALGDEVTLHIGILGFKD